MKPRFSNKRNQALTLIEVLVVIVVLAVLAALLLHIPSRTHNGRKRISCVNNLKEIGLAYRVWEGDYGDKYPMEVSVTNGGTMELVADGKNTWLNYLVMSNELSTPKVLICPADTDHSFAINFGTDFNNSHISYFVGLDAKEMNPQMFLSGDDNFAVAGVPVKSGLLELSTNTAVSWTAARHKFFGNIGLADGSVQEISSLGLQQAFQQPGAAVNRIAIP